MVEQERLRLGCRDQGEVSAPRYTVCVCNYNMDDTLERAMTSVIEQLDEQYEVLVIDDGSNDGSVDILKMLADRYDRFRFIALSRDPNRLLGETRNISIRAARGEYVLLHIDADDLWEPYLQEFVILFHKIEEIRKGDFYLSGQQTGIAKRELMLSYGSYENIYRCEDRSMMMKLAKGGKIMFLDYKVYRTRLGRSLGKKIAKTLRETCSQMMFDMRQIGSKKRYILRTLIAPITGSQFSKKLTLFRAFVIIPVYISSCFREKITTEMSWDEFLVYHENKRGTYSEVMTKLGGDPDISFLSQEAQEIFSYKIKLKGIRSS